ncbi:hypothetical protein KP696_19325 [Nocardia seriolae]|nr:hypothetical protein [Nocardia seriolae]MTJ71404.1 hypothetical protein [Nocardia seriolae]MTJ90994.1 hypothetical protein [Nocardia seriolae]MTK34951.1 hypothetical protein [Nocardia seriolae]MTK38850.1 hypothetical protein [Nocardia seriolae]
MKRSFTPSGCARRRLCEKEICMKLGTWTTAACLATAVACLTTAGANAEPATVRHTTATGIDQGIGYQATLSELSRVLTTAVSGGAFTTAPDASEITLTSDDGAVVARIPLSYRLSGATVQVERTISDDGHRLVLAPKVTATEISEMQQVGSMTQLMNEINQNVAAVAIGGALGGLIGTVIGLGFFSIVTGPIGLLVGAIAGGYAMGGQPFMDAVTAVVSGRP